MQIVTQDEATANFSKLIDDAIQQGQEVIVLRNRIAVAKIVPLSQPKGISEPALPRQPGSVRGLIHMRDDFEDPLDDFAEYQ